GPGAHRPRPVGPRVRRLRRRAARGGAVLGVVRLAARRGPRRSEGGVMIIDVHSHIWQYPDHFSDDFRRQARRAKAGVELDLTVRWEDYQATSVPGVRTVVFGGKARHSGLWVDDRFVADYVGRHPESLIGFLSVDPTQEGWQRELEEGHKGLGLCGIKLLPMYAGFRPDEARTAPLSRYASLHQLPVLLLTGTTFIAQAPLECTLPRHL